MYYHVIIINLSPLMVAMFDFWLTQNKHFVEDHQWVNPDKFGSMVSEKKNFKFYFSMAPLC